MHAHAATHQFTVTHFGVWRGAVITLCALAVLAMGWWARAHQVQATATPMAWAVSLLFVPATLWLAWPLCRCPPIQLRKHAQGWQLLPLRPPGQAAWEGEIHVALDLGAWMLLRFHSPAPAQAGHSRWLPVQRLGMEAQWHALRCAVYAPAGSAAGAVPPAV